MLSLLRLKPFNDLGVKNSLLTASVVEHFSEKTENFFIKDSTRIYQFHSLYPQSKISKANQIKSFKKLVAQNRLSKAATNSLVRVHLSEPSSNAHFPSFTDSVQVQPCHTCLKSPHITIQFTSPPLNILPLLSTPAFINVCNIF